MCDIHMLFKIVMVCLRVADPHSISDHICVCTIRTHMHRLLLEDLALALKQVLSFCPIPPITTLLSAGHM